MGCGRKRKTLVLIELRLESEPEQKTGRGKETDIKGVFTHVCVCL